MASINYFRKAYKDAISEGLSVIEGNNIEAINEVNNLYSEVLRILNMIS
jgi:hypothetical protein